MRKPTRCPDCGAHKILRIVYGLGTPDSFGPGNIGYGCIVEDNAPLWHCAACKHAWGEKEAGRL